MFREKKFWRTNKKRNVKGKYLEKPINKNTNVSDRGTWIKDTTHGLKEDSQNVFEDELS